MRKHKSKVLIGKSDPAQKLQILVLLNFCASLYIFSEIFFTILFKLISKVPITYLNESSLSQHYSVNII